MSEQERELVPRRFAFLQNVVALLANRYGAKGLEALLLGVAFRTLDRSEIGLVFLTQAAAGIVFLSIDLGLYPVVARRSARRRIDGPLLARLSLLRLLGVLVLTAGYGVYAMLELGEHAVLATAFFMSSGLQSVHELPRAAITGAERFGRLTALGLTGKTVESGFAIAGLLLGFGLPAWLGGRIASHIAIATLAIPLARAAVHDSVSTTSTRGLVREGLPFWVSSLFALVAIRLDTLFVAGFGGLDETAQLGVANRVLGGALGIVSAGSYAAFPSLARERRRFIRRREGWFVFGLALLLGGTLFAAAPWIVLLLEGHADGATVRAVRAMAPVVTLFALSRPLETWLQAKQQETLLVRVSALHMMFSVAALATFVPRFGIAGAALARPVRATFELGCLFVATLLALSPVPAPLGYRLAVIPSLRKALKSAHAWRVRRLAARLGHDPSVLAVHVDEVDGRGAEPGFAHHRVIAIVRDGTTSAPETSTHRTIAGVLDVLVVDAGVAEVCREFDVPELRFGTKQTSAHASTRTTSRAFALRDALSAFVAMQRDAIAHSRPDGSVRMGMLAPDVRRFDEALRAFDAAAGTQDEPVGRAAHDESQGRIRAGRSRTSLGHVAASDAAQMLADAHCRLAERLSSVASECALAAESTCATASPIAGRPSYLAAILGLSTVERLVVLPVGPERAGCWLVASGSAFSRTDDPSAWVEWIRTVGPDPGGSFPLVDTMPPLVLPESALELAELIDDAPLSSSRFTPAPLALRGSLLARRTLGEQTRRDLATTTLARMLLSVSHLVPTRPLLRRDSPLRRLLDARGAALLLEFERDASSTDDLASAYAARHDDALAVYLTQRIGSMDEADQAMKAFGDGALAVLRRVRTRSDLATD